MSHAFIDQCIRIARLHAEAATRSTTQAEANHWWAESDRFADLAELARNDPAAARAAYRPTCAYEAEVA
jgi:hypothetical protein